jgi:hypothetical protein
MGSNISSLKKIDNIPDEDGYYRYLGRGIHFGNNTFCSGTIYSKCPLLECIPLDEPEDIRKENDKHYWNDDNRFIRNGDWYRVEYFCKPAWIKYDNGKYILCVAKIPNNNVEVIESLDSITYINPEHLP